MTTSELETFLRDTAEQHGIPGASVGVYAGGQELFASTGVTSLAGPRPVTEHTPFDVGSVSKTFTATAVVRLAAAGWIALDAPVSRYVPEFDVSPGITVLRLLNHTAGIDWRLLEDTGDGDGALAAFVKRLAGQPLIAEPGERASYSQAGYSVLGRVLETVTGLTFEGAVAELALRPAGLSRTTYLPQEGGAEGHNPGPDGAPVATGPWHDTRANNPGGGIVAPAADLLRWARHHLAAEPAVARMREPTVALRASSLGDAFGLCWFLREAGGVRLAGHGGSANGQFAELLLAPERDFAVVSLANAEPGGIPFNQAVLRWALEHHLGVVDGDPEPLPYDAGRAAELAGSYGNDVMDLVIADHGDGLTLAAGIKAEIRAAARGEMPPDVPPSGLGLLPGDEYLVTEGSMRGQRGYATRDAAGRITGVDLAGRLFPRAGR